MGVADVLTSVRARNGVDGECKPRRNHLGKRTRACCSWEIGGP